MERKPDIKEEDTSTDEEELDIRSENFNPLKAIYSKKLKTTNVKKFDNVAVSILRISHWNLFLKKVETKI